MNHLVSTSRYHGMSKADLTRMHQVINAGQANAWRIFVRHEVRVNLSNLRLLVVKKLPALSYGASGGFSGPALYPGWLFGAIQLCHQLLGSFPSIFATRLMVVLERVA